MNVASLRGTKKLPVCTVTPDGEDLCEESGLDDEASCTACGKCCEWDGSRCTYNLTPEEVKLRTMGPSGA